ncbi:hypothetical protein V8C34DRAFT_266780, partial [Trichoderma compactum]
MLQDRPWKIIDTKNCSLCASKRRSTCTNSAIKRFSLQLASPMRCKERLFFLLLACRGPYGVHVSHLLIYLL